MQTRFNVFGEPVEILISSEQTGNAFSIARQTCKPGGGTPPHLHHNEDEAFSVITGRFELFNGETWSEIPEQAVILVPRRQVHCFRNCGSTDGTIQFICSGGAFDKFLEGLSRFNLPEDVQAIVDYSASFGIFYPTLPPPTELAAAIR